MEVRQPRFLDLVVGALAVGAGAAYLWAINDLHTNSAGALATWVAALVLVVTVLVAMAHKGRHVGWFHPLSLPLATLALMSLGAPLWVYFTHNAKGLLYDTGYQPVISSTLAVAVSVTTCEALTLAVLGYIVGVGVAFAITKKAPPTNVDAQMPKYHYRDMRRAGLTFMIIGAASQITVTALGTGSAYGANQLHYGLASVLRPGAATALLVGLLLATLATSHTTKPRRVRHLLGGWEWSAVSSYILAVALSGQRAGLIAPIVYFAWAYSTQVRVIALRRIVAAVLLALIDGAVISNYRHNGTLSSGSPKAVAQSAVADMSSSAWLTQQTVIHVPSMAPYLHGSTYLAAVESQLPGPVARSMGAPTRTASAVFRNVVGFFNPNQGFAESYPSEAYLNFGLGGCLGAGLFLGMLMGWAWRKRSEVATRTRDFLYPVLLAGLVYGFRSDALAQIKDVLYPMLALWILMGWYQLRSASVGQIAAAVVSNLDSAFPTSTRTASIGGKAGDRRGHQASYPDAKEAASFSRRSDRAEG
jgi:O-antigen polysaccharide polymerase Wzy